MEPISIAMEDDRINKQILIQDYTSDVMNWGKDFQTVCTNPKLAGFLNQNESYCLYNSGPMVRHYALLYGFYTLPNMLKNLLERHVALFMCTNA